MAAVFMHFHRLCEMIRVFVAVHFAFMTFRTFSCEHAVDSVSFSEHDFCDFIKQISEYQSNKFWFGFRLNLSFSDICDMDSIEILRIDQFSGRQPAEGFSINRLSDHLRTSHKHIEKPHRHDFYATIFFDKGHGIHSIDFKTYEVTPGALFFMSPGQMHHWELSPDADGWVFFHSRTFYESRFLDERLSDYPFFSLVAGTDMLMLDTAQRAVFSNRCREMYDCQLSSEVFRRHFVLSQISLVYIEAAELARVENSSPASSVYLDLFRRFTGFLEADFKIEKSPEYYAGRLSVTSKHLNRVLQTLVGKTTSEVISDRVILEAKRVLLHSWESLGNIALKLGYEDYAYFSKLFRKKTGVTPMEFRKNGS